MGNIFGITKRILMNNLKNILLMYLKLTLKEEEKILYIFDFFNFFHYFFYI